MSENYSALIYECEFSKDTYEKILKYITSGTKVYYITNSLQSILENVLKEDEISYLKYLQHNYLLSLNFNINLYIKEGVFTDGNIPSSIKSKLINTKFNIEQYEIEHLHKDLHIIIKAGAGTGKTKTMIDRTLYLRHKDHSTFKNMVMITFTNKAAINMKEALTKRLECYYNVTGNYKYLNWIDELNEMKIKTIHSFAKDFIHECGDVIKIDRNCKITTIKYEKYKMIEEIINRYRHDYYKIYNNFKYIPQYKIIKSIMNLNEYLLNKGIDIETNIHNVNFGIDKYGFNYFMEYLLVELNKEIGKFKEENCCLEVTDLITKLKRFINNKFTMRNINIKYIMIDEFQDSDTTQVEFIIWLINTFNCKSFVVGDAKQSIYRFRGADYTAFIQFEKYLLKHGEFVKKTLKKNYRNDKLIINKLNNFFYNISHESFTREENKYFKFNMDDKLEPMMDYKDKECKISYFNDQSEVGYIDYIIDLINKNNFKNKLLDRDKQEDIAILVRTNKDLEHITNVLEGRGIICKKEVSGRFYRSIAIREFYIMLKALLYPNVYINQYAFINSSYGLGINNEEVLKNFDVNTNYLKKIIEKNSDYKKLRKYREQLNFKPFIIVLKDIVNEFMPDINYGIKKIMKRSDCSNEDINNFIRQIRTSTINYKINLMNLFTILDKKFSGINSSIFDIEKFLRIMIATDDIEDEKMLSFKDNQYDITCMTVHKAKGLEFDHVILPNTKNLLINNYSDINVFLNMNNNKFDLAYSIRLNEDNIIKNDIYLKDIKEENKQVIAEEIRLLYVALTRAKKSLHIYKDNIVSNSGKLGNWMCLLEAGGL